MVHINILPGNGFTLTFTNVLSIAVAFLYCIKNYKIQIEAVCAEPLPAESVQMHMGEERERRSRSYLNGQTSVSIISTEYW